MQEATNVPSSLNRRAECTVRERLKQKPDQLDPPVTHRNSEKNLDTKLTSANVALARVSQAQKISIPFECWNHDVKSYIVHHKCTCLLAHMKYEMCCEKTERRGIEDRNEAS